MREPHKDQMKEPGVLMFCGVIVYYDCSGDWIKANELGKPDLLPMTPELNRAIHEDLARGRRKAAELADGSIALGPARRAARG